jgi:hypothetical protein
MSEKLSAAELVYIAITWAEEGMIQMIDGCHNDDPYRADVKNQLKQMRAYRRRRFGKPTNPFEGAKLVNMTEMRALTAQTDNKS